MFDANGDFIHDHDLEDGLWDGHGYDCTAPVDACVCEDSIDLEDEDEDDSEDWADLATYHAGR